MIIELDTSLLEIIDNISINQLVFLSLVLDKNQKSHQGITPLIRLVSDSCLLYTSPSPRDRQKSRMPSSA